MTTRRRWLWAFPAVLLAIATVVAVCEWRGWPFLEGPAERWLSQRLDREVDFQDGTNSASGGPGRRFHLRLIGPLRLEAAGLRIANPAWSTRQPMLQASDAQLRTRWRDLFALRRGEPLAVSSGTTRSRQSASSAPADSPFSASAPVNWAATSSGVTFGRTRRLARSAW